MKAQGALPHTLGKEKPSQGRENRLTAKPEHVGMLRIFRQLRKSCKGTHRGGGYAPRASPAIHTLPLSIALLSIWGASLLPIANCLFIAYPRLSERQPVGCHSQSLTKSPVTRPWRSPLSSGRLRLPPTLRYAPRLPSDSHLLLLALQMRPLALKGRQITDGGKQRVAPGHGKLITPPPCADGAREGVGGGWRLIGGYASLTPVCILSPPRG